MGFFKKKKNILPPAEDHIEANLANSTVYVRDLQKIYPSAKGDVQAMKDVNINVMENEFVSIVGPSGCGKSTLLRMIGGLDTATSGKIVIQDRDIIGPGADRGMVFQSYTLFPWMTVGDNIKFGLKLRKMPADQQEEILNKYLKIIKLEKFRDSYPRELSGGMKQRVAIARALANSPEVLLMDEQFAAIDAKVRSELRLWLRSVVTKLGITSIFVTHDQDEAVEVADEIIITNHGTIEQIGTPAEIYNTPDTPFVAQFIGRSSLVEHYEELHGFDKIEGAAKAVIRPEFVKIHKFGKIDRYMSASQDGIVKDIVFRGNRLDVTVDVGGIEMICEWPLEKESLEIGEKVSLLIYRLYVLDKERTYLCENKEMQEDDVFYI